MRLTRTSTALCVILSGCDPSQTPAPAKPQLPAAAKHPPQSSARMQETTAEAARPEPESEPDLRSMFDEKPVSSERGTATWYNVPQNSLAKRRAPDEFTAAHNRLPLGSYVRVTDEENGRSVVVRVTDRGIRSKHSIDLCKEAAETIGIVGEGVAKVRIELLKEQERE